MAKTSGLTKAFAWFFALTGVLTVYVAATSESSTSGGDGRETLLSSGACATAKNAVRDYLKAPSTAKFSDCYEVRANEEGTRFFVKGHVDAHNSFGAMLRKEYAVFVVMPKGGTISDMTAEKIAIN